MRFVTVAAEAVAGMEWAPLSRSSQTDCETRVESLTQQRHFAGGGGAMAYGYAGRMANEFEYFALHYRELLLDTAHLDNEQLGMFIRLFLRSWDESPAATLPSTDALLAQIARCTSVEWSEAKAAVLPCFQVTKGNRIQHRRLRQTYDALRERKKLNKERASLGGKAKRAKELSAISLLEHAPSMLTETKTQTQTEIKTTSPPGMPRPAIEELVNRLMLAMQIETACGPMQKTKLAEIITIGGYDAALNAMQRAWNKARGGLSAKIAYALAIVAGEAGEKEVTAPKPFRNVNPVVTKAVIHK